jgi:hypothetical protein
MHSGEEGKKTAARLPLCIEGKKKKTQPSGCRYARKEKRKKKNAARGDFSNSSFVVATVELRELKSLSSRQDISSDQCCCIS